MHNLQVLPMRCKMKFKISLILLMMLVGFPATVAAGLFKVVRVYDGDTIKAVGYDIEIKVRLVGIDAPETSKGKRKAGQPFGRKAEKQLAALVLNKLVDIKGYGLDRYGRILGEIYIDGQNVNLTMVKAGYAEVYSGRPPRGLHMQEYQKAENWARSNRRGIWSQDDQYISPARWRKSSM